MVLRPAGFGRIAAVATIALGLAWPAAASATKFRFPLDDPGGAHIIHYMILGVDHDPVDHSPPNIHCLAYDCRTDFPACYDEHRGTDYPLDGGWDLMDAESLTIVAAADGEVVDAVDGNYDRCHADASTGGVTCDGYPMQANYVAIRHADGVVSEYYHMRKGSVLPKVGDHVTCGQPIGRVGSSGISAMPHLHFQVMTPEGKVVDPYAGACSQAESYWVLQDGPGALPGPWCEGQAIPDWQEPGPEEAVELAAELPEAEATTELPAETVPAGDEAVEALAEDVLPDPEEVATAEEPAAGETIAIAEEVSAAGPEETAAVDARVADDGPAVADAAEDAQRDATSGDGLIGIRARPGGCTAGAGAGLAGLLPLALLAVLRRRRAA